MNELDKAYLGDSVYVSHTGTGMLRLTTENGMGPTNEIFLEGFVLRALNDYVVRLREKAGDRTFPV